jgi:hypothetical protein
MNLRIRFANKRRAGRIDERPAVTENVRASPERNMQWYCFEDQLYVGDWRVERNDSENKAATQIAIFSGPNARERAQEYADWKNSAERHRPISRAS